MHFVKDKGAGISDRNSFNKEGKKTAFTPNEEIRQELTAVVESEAYVTDSRYIVKTCDELEKRNILFKGEGTSDEYTSNRKWL